MGAGAIIGAVVAGAASAAGSTIFGATMLASVVTGASLGRMFDRPKSASPTYSFGELDNTYAQRIPIPVTYGRVKVAGNIIYHRISNNEKELFMVVGLGEGPIESVEDIRVNDEPITSIKGYVEHHVRLGTEIQSAISWVDTGETWPNTAYIACRFKASEDLSMTPTITCVVKGRKVRTWSGSGWVSQYSNNPAWCILDLMTNSRYGVGIKEQYIDFDSFRTEAQYCDELVDDGNGGQEPRFRLDYNVDFQRSSLDLIDEILSTFRGYILYSDGKLRLQIEKSQVPVQSFTMDNIVADSFSYSKASLKEIPNQIRVEWIDPESNWEQADISYDNEVDQEERGDVLTRTITLYGVTRPGQAGREARFYHDSGYICNTFCEFRVGIDSLHCEVGDVVKVSHDVPGWIEKEFRILEIQEEENDEMVLRCREYNSAIYHDRGSVYAAGRATTLPNPNAPPASVLNLTLIEEHKQPADGTWIPQIKVTWEEPDGITWRAGNVWLSADNGSSWEFVRQVEGTGLTIDVGGNQQYLVKVVSENQKRIKEDFGSAATGNITILGKRSNPSNVQWADCFFVDSVELNWLTVPERDIAGYEIRTEDDNWGAVNQHLVYRGSELRYVFAPSVREYTFYLKAYDRQGNYSLESAVEELELPMPPAPQQPNIEEYFTAIKVGIIPVNLPSVKGYNLYVKNLETEVEEAVPLSFATVETYSAPSGKTFEVTVAAFDVLGEGPRSEPLQATTTNINIEIDEELLEESPLIKSLDTRLTDAEGELLDQGAQIETLSDEITLKVQKRTSDGKYVVTGIGAAIGEDGQSEIGILADIFRMHTTVNGESQAIFVVDGPSGKIYLLGDLIADGTIMARQLDAEAVRTHLVQAELAYLDEANVLHLRADKITVGGGQSVLSITKPKDSILWHFNTSLYSTNGHAPTGSASLNPNGKFGSALELAQGDNLVYQIPSSNKVTFGAYLNLLN